MIDINKKVDDIIHHIITAETLLHDLRVLWLVDSSVTRELSDKLFELRYEIQDKLRPETGKSHD